jgi:hypothetical protein
MFHLAFDKLKNYCSKEQYKGYDPYDGLNSKFFQSLPFVCNSKWLRLIWIQLFKRLPINLRPLVGIDKEYNSKGIALFLSGYCRQYKLSPSDENLNAIKFLVRKLVELRNPNYSGSCWGYPFDWQARAFFQPRNTPTVVATTYAGCALLDAYGILGDENCLRHARSACDFVLKDLNRTQGQGDSFAFSYSPLDNSVVYNASLLGSRLLSRVYSITKEEDLKTAARQSVVFCCNKQRSDGAWSYGDYDFHQWIDNFHTGFNIECISQYASNCADDSFNSNIQKGFSYYIRTFFTPEGMSKYYDNQLYPIDIHAPAQLVATIDELGEWKNHQELVERVLKWTINNMQDESGYFIYQKKRFWSSSIPYMRWGQAWMFLAFSIYLSPQDVKEN